MISLPELTPYCEDEGYSADQLRAYAKAYGELLRQEDWNAGYDAGYTDALEAQAERIRVLREALGKADEVLEYMGCNQTSAACRAALEATQ